MPDKPTQFYVIRVQKMCTSPDFDLVPGWTAVVAEENLGKLSLEDASKVTDLVLKNAPVEGMRPMTEEEIAEWRAAEAGDDGDAY